MADEMAIPRPDNMPMIGSKHIHKGGNIWAVTRYAYVVVHISDQRSVTIGDCIFLRCTSAPGGSDTRWTFEQFASDFEPF